MQEIAEDQLCDEQQHDGHHADAVEHGNGDGRTERERDHAAEHAREQGLAGGRRSRCTLCHAADVHDVGARSRERRDEREERQ